MPNPKPTPKIMTDATYLKSEGNKCPACESKACNSSRNIQADGIWLTREVSCEDCGYVWQDLYELQGIVR